MPCRNLCASTGKVLNCEVMVYAGLQWAVALLGDGKPCLPGGLAVTCNLSQPHGKKVSNLLLLQGLLRERERKRHSVLSRAD